MGNAKQKGKPPELKVVFDSNAVYSQTGSYLLKNEVYELIQANSQHTDLVLSWQLPEVVRHERQYQLLNQSLGLLPAIEKLEKLLGHNLLITDQIITERVQQGIEKQIKDLNLTVLPTDPAKVDWNKMMFNAAYRNPPFSTGEKEKGFRDALIAEAFSQLVEASPKTPRVCRIALVTADVLLTEVAKTLTSASTNVRILPTLEELKGLINTLVSEVEEEFVEKVKGAAASLFFEPKQEDSLYLKERVLPSLVQKFRKELDSLPEGANEREQGITLIGAPQFRKKEGQRIYWVTRITIQVEAYKSEAEITMTIPASPYLTTTGLVSLSSSEEPVKVVPGTVSLADLASFYPKPLKDPFNLFPPRTRSLIKTGKVVFEVTWSVSVTTTGKLSGARIEAIEYVETTWD